jgi:hypothetical protein
MNDKRGLTGNSGFCGPVHYNMPYSCNDGVFVPDPDMEMSWLRMSAEEAKTKGLTPIRCNCCPAPATRMGHMWPWESVGTTCDSEECQRKDRTGDDY